MYVAAYDALEYPFEQNGLGQCVSTPAGSMTFSDIIAAIECELRRPFTDPNDPRLLVRRRRLRELFNGIPAPRAKDLFDQLKQPSDSLARLFRLRLATATRKELLSILFFAEFDLRFEPTSATAGVQANPRMTAAEKTLRIADVNNMVAELLLRRDARAADALTGAVPAATAALPGLMPVATRLSTAQLALFREFFADAAGGIDLDAFQRSFEQFNNGELRNPAAPGQREPNGGFEFLFAEFAFLCVNSAIDVAEWTRLLRVYVQTQEIFIHIYRPPPHRAPPRVNAPRPACPVGALGSPSPRRPLDGPTGFADTNFDTVGRSGPARKAALRAKYARMNVAALRNAARDNMLRAQCMT
jgi:hypothetical protein